MSTETQKTKKADKKSLSFLVGDTVEVKIESLSIGNGAGIAKHEGKVIFVPLAVPGETCTVKLTKIKKNFSEALKIKTIVKSKFEVEAKCDVFGKCGGCQWQNVSYQEQLNQKENYLSHLSKQLIKHKDYKFNGIKRSKHVYGYRNRIQVHSFGGNTGYYAKGSKKIVKITECPIAIDQVSAGMRHIRGEGRFDIRLNDKNKIRVIRVKASTDLEFTQVNQDQNKYLMELTKKVVRLAGPSQVTDLYCGAGNFSISLAKSFEDIQVVGVESHEKAIKTAKEQGLNFKNLEFVHQKAEQFLSSKLNGLIILDPPRSGVGEELINSLVKSGVKDIIYISCHPMTWQRDVLALQVKGKFKLKNLEAIDMFPQTSHLELFSWLRCE